MKEKQFEKWTNLRKKGKTNYILTNGLLAWGLPMFVVMTFVVNKPETGYISLGMMAINALIWALAGLGFGYFTWVASEKSYEKELIKRENV